MAGRVPFGRQRGGGNRPQLVRGLGFVLIGGLILAVLWPVFMRDMGWNGRSGTLSVTSCTLGTGSHPINTCRGVLHLGDDSATQPGAWVTTQDYFQPGSAVPVQVGTDGSLRTATDTDRLAVGAGVLLSSGAVVAGLVELVRLVIRRTTRRP